MKAVIIIVAIISCLVCLVLLLRPARRIQLENDRILEDAMRTATRRMDESEMDQQSSNKASGEEIPPGVDR